MAFPARTTILGCQPMTWMKHPVSTSPIVSLSSTWHQVGWPQAPSSSELASSWCCPTPGQRCDKCSSDQIWYQSSCWVGLLGFLHYIQETSTPLNSVPKTSCGHRVAQPGSHHNTNRILPGSLGCAHEIPPSTQSFV